MARPPIFKIGDRYNNLTIVAEDEWRYRQRYVKAKCVCGSTGSYLLSALKRGAIKSCGCKKKKYPTVSVGDVFDRLTIIEIISTTIASKVKCRCICGKETFVKINMLNTGRTRSCGCLHDEIRGNVFRTHGLSNHKINALYRGIKKRCYNPKDAKFRYYGGHPTGSVTMCAL